MISLRLSAGAVRGAISGCCFFGFLVSVNQAEGEGKAEKKSEVAEQDEAVRLEDGLEHADVERHRGVGYYPHQQQVQLQEVLVHHSSHRKILFT